MPWTIRLHRALLSRATSGVDSSRASFSVGARSFTNTRTWLRTRAMPSTAEVRIPPVDDFHHHFRDGDVLKDTVQHACRMFRRAVSQRNVCRRDDSGELVQSTEYFLVPLQLAHSVLTASLGTCISRTHERNSYKSPSCPSTSICDLTLPMTRSLCPT